MKNKLFSLLVAVTLCMLPVLSMAQDEPVQMNNLGVTDLSVSTAFISWTTDQKTIVNKIEVTGPDSTWEVMDNYINPAYTHLVKITGMEQGTDYSYKIDSDGTVWDNNGESYTFTTLANSGVNFPKTVWGELQNSWGDVVERSLVRYRLLSEDGTVSMPRAVLTDTAGVWIGDAGIMYNEDGTMYQYYGNDKIIIEYVPNYWTTAVDSTNEIGPNTNYNFGVQSIQVTDPSAASPGDVDGNGALNIFDVLDLLKVIGKKVTPDPRMQAASDLDNNGKIDIFDLLALLKKMKPAR